MLSQRSADLSVTFGISGSGELTQTLTVPGLCAVSVAFVTTPADIPALHANVTYAAVLRAHDTSADPAAPTFRVASGELPAGLVLDGRTGALSGVTADVRARAVVFEVTSTVGHVTAQLVLQSFGVLAAPPA